MTTIKGPEVGQMMKMASAQLSRLTGENAALKEKLAQYERRDRVQKIASKMVEKGIEPSLSAEDRVAGLMQREDLDVVEQAVEMSAPQMKIAGIYEDGRVITTGVDGSQAAQDFAAALLSD